MGPNWEEDPWLLKKYVDPQFCNGLNRNMLCFYVHQPYLDIKPGYQWPAAGTHFDRNITWWDQSHAFFDYLSRCQLLLQEGLSVADVCYFVGEDAPSYCQVYNKIPAGYDNDSINGEVLMTRLAVKDGRLVLPDGTSYSVLVLPPAATMTPEGLTKVAALVEAGQPSSARRLRAPRASKTTPLATRSEGLGRKGLGPSDRTKHGRGEDSARRAPLWEGPDRLGQDGCGGSSRQWHPAGLRLEGSNLDYIHRSTDDGEIYFRQQQQRQWGKGSLHISRQRQAAGTVGSGYRGGPGCRCLHPAT